MTDPVTRLVTLTITEKGYTADLTSMTLDREFPENKWMLTHSAGKRKALEALSQGIAPHMSGLAYITAALNVRKKNNLPGFTVLSCDNL